MPLVGIDLLFQVLFALHAIRTGRDRYWLYLILMLPGIGCLIYFIAEILPEIVHGPGKKAHKRVKKALDPGKDYRDAKYALETTPTIASRLHLAQICMAKGDYDEVIAVLEPALAGQFSQDPSLLEGLAFAHFYKREYKNALNYIQRIYAHEDLKPKDYVRLLRVRVLEETGDLDGALAELTELVKFFSGEEARIELATLHEKMRNHDKAREIYLDIVNRAKRAPAYYRKREKEWISIAEQRLGSQA